LKRYNYYRRKKMEDKKRVKKATVNDLKKEVAELHNSLGEAQELLLTKAVTIGRLQDNNVVMANTLTSTRKEVEERGVLLAKARDEVATLKGELLHAGESIEALYNASEMREQKINKLRERVHTYEERDIPVNGCAQAGPPRIPEMVFRIITNGKRYSVQKSYRNYDGRDTWIDEQELKRVAHGRAVTSVSRWTYRGAKRFIIKQYGERVRIEPREWRQV
jgi:hypothetical protein